MDSCRRVRDMLLEADRFPVPGAEDHLRTCGTCTTLAGSLVNDERALARVLTPATSSRPRWADLHARACQRRQVQVSHRRLTLATAALAVVLLAAFHSEAPPFPGTGASPCEILSGELERRIGPGDPDNPFRMDSGMLLAQVENPFATVAEECNPFEISREWTWGSVPEDDDMRRFETW